MEGLYTKSADPDCVYSMLLRIAALFRTGVAATDSANAVHDLPSALCGQFEIIHGLAIQAADQLEAELSEANKRDGL